VFGRLFGATKKNASEKGRTFVVNSRSAMQILPRHDRYIAQAAKGQLGGVERDQN
jgi:hypothetical protein